MTTVDSKVEVYNRDEYIAQVSQLVDKFHEAALDHPILQVTPAILSILIACYEAADEKTKMIIRGGIKMTFDPLFKQDLQ